MSVEIAQPHNGVRAGLVGLRLNQRDIQRAFRAAQKAGSSIARMEVNPVTGTVVFVCADPTVSVKKGDDYASWKACR